MCVKPGQDQFFHLNDFPPRVETYIGCDPAATSEETLLGRGKADTDYWAIVVGARECDFKGNVFGPIYVLDVWRGRVTKQRYVDVLTQLYEFRRPEQVLVESNGAQEYLVQDLKELMPVKGVKRTKDKVSRAYWLQGFFERGEILLPAKELARSWEPYEAMIEELLLFPQGEHDDLFDALETMVEGAAELHSGGGFAFA